jgi:hypothetical protein
MPFIKSIRKRVDRENNLAQYVEVVGGDVVYTAGGYKIHMFTTVGQHNLQLKVKDNLKHAPDTVKNYLISGSNLNTEFLAIGGGGGGGARHSGGGGAGGLVESTAGAISGNVSISVGGGGNGGVNEGFGQNGQNTTFSTVTAIGGGGGSTWDPAFGPGTGSTGGSGGGGSQNGGGGGPANQPSPNPLGGVGYGFRGGNSIHSPPTVHVWAGGGGGAGGAGADGPAYIPQSQSPPGGPGRQSSITGTNYHWAGGGGGGTWNGNTGGQGGNGGGGGGTGGPAGTGGPGLNVGQNGQNAGPQAQGTIGGQGGNNTGGGGGGANQVPSTGGRGGPGIVVVRYLT